MHQPHRGDKRSWCTSQSIKRALPSRTGVVHHLLAPHSSLLAHQTREKKKKRGPKVLYTWDENSTPTKFPVRCGQSSRSSSKPTSERQRLHLAERVLPPTRHKNNQLPIPSCLPPPPPRAQERTARTFFPLSHVCPTAVAPTPHTRTHKNQPLLNHFCPIPIQQGGAESAGTPARLCRHRS